jgi:transcriptional regulator with GAF, ATPase, and Fis domain
MRDVVCGTLNRKTTGLRRPRWAWRPTPPPTRSAQRVNGLPANHDATLNTPLGTSVLALRTRLDTVKRAWTADNYAALLRFYVQIIPRLLEAERCGIFVLDTVRNRLLSKAGTGLHDGEIEAPMDGSVVGTVATSGERFVDNALESRDGFHRTADRQTGFVTRSMICAPVRSVADGQVIGALQVLNKHSPEGFDEADLEMVDEVCGYLSMALDNILLNDEIRNVSVELEREVDSLSDALTNDSRFIAASETMRAVLDTVQMVGATPVDVVIHGENGTGKELVARMIHRARHSDDAGFVAVNCAAIPESLMESEFFGYEKGAFTGATTARKGRFVEADGGTLFLDEVADMPISMQPKFLRALQEGECTPLGSNESRAFNVRVISASNRGLREAVDAGEFREDLFYRLFAVEVVVPPLRARRDDIAPMAITFVDEVCRRFGREAPPIASELLAVFENYAWPGNVRQLMREVERLVALTPAGEPLTPTRCSPELLREVGDLGDVVSITSTSLHLPEQVQGLEIRLIRSALARTSGNKLRAAEELGITRQGLHKKLKRYGLE